MVYLVFEKLWISVQLWLIKDDVKVDFVGILQVLVDMGFDGVEFVGDFGLYQNNLIGLKVKLVELGLVVSGVYVGFNVLCGDKLVVMVLFYQQFGMFYVIVFWDECVFVVDIVDLVVKELIVIVECLVFYGLCVGYYNYVQEMVDYGDIIFWQYIVSNMLEFVVLQQDVGWMLVVEKDLVVMVKVYLGRILIMYFKVFEYEMFKGMFIVGQDGINWLLIYQVIVVVGGVKWVVFEQE